MRRDHAPAFREAHPGLHLAAHLAGHAGAPKQRRGRREIAPIGGDDGLVDRAGETGRRARGAKGLDLSVAVEVFAAAVADRARVVAKDAVERRDVVRHQRLLVALELPSPLGNDLRPVDVHVGSPDILQREGLGAVATPARSSAYAIRSATSSRQGAAMTW